MERLEVILGIASLTAFLVGALGFAIGFYGPILVTPEANQGPLLGIFVTGPGGAILGAIFGAYIGYRKTKNG